MLGMWSQTDERVPYTIGIVSGSRRGGEWRWISKSIASAVFVLLTLLAGTTCEGRNYPPVVVLHGIMGCKLWSEVLHSYAWPEDLKHRCSEWGKRAGRYFSWPGESSPTDCMLHVLG
jgi:hypothetical protein